jgi:hypothetical protein
LGFSGHSTDHVASRPDWHDDAIIRRKSWRTDYLLILLN